MDRIKRKENRHYLTVWFSVVCVLLMLNTVTARATDIELRDPRQFFFIQSFGDMPEELLTARSQHKQGILLFYEADGCPYCTAMLKGVLSQKKVQDWYRERFLSIAIDIRGDLEIKDFDTEYKVYAETRGLQNAEGALVTPAKKSTN